MRCTPKGGIAVAMVNSSGRFRELQCVSDCARVTARPSQAHRMFKACKEHSPFLPCQSRAYAALPASCPPPAAMLLPEPAALAAQQAAPSSRQRSAASCKRVGGMARHSLFMLHGLTSLHILRQCTLPHDLLMPTHLPTSSSSAFRFWTSVDSKPSCSALLSCCCRASCCSRAAR